MSLRVTVTDEQTGDTDTCVVPEGDYLLVCHEPLLAAPHRRLQGRGNARGHHQGPEAAMSLRRSPLRRVSKRRAKVLPDLHAASEAAFQRDGYRCQAHALMLDLECGDWPLVAHHLVTRSAWPAGLCVLSNLLTVCGIHHRAIHAAPARARELGLLRHSWDRPDGDAA